MQLFWDVLELRLSIEDPALRSQPGNEAFSKALTMKHFDAAIQIFSPCCKESL